MKKNNYLLISILLSSLIIAFLFPLKSTFERGVKNSINNTLSKKGIEISAKKDFSPINTIKLKDVVIKKASLKFSTNELGLCLSRKGISVNIKNLKLDNNKLSIDTSHDGSGDINLKLSWMLKLKGFDINIDQLHVLLENGIDLYAVDIKSSNDNNIGISSLSVINEFDRKFKKIESDYINIDFANIDLLKRSGNINISFRYLPLSYDKAGVDFYDTTFSSSFDTRNLSLSISSSSMDIKTGGNILLTLDDVGMKLSSNGALWQQKYSYSLVSNIISLSANIDLKKKVLDAKAKASSSDDISVDFKINFSDISNFSANVNLNVDTFFPSLDIPIKGSAFSNIESGKISLMSEGFDVGKFKVVPFADFNFTDKAKSVYLDFELSGESYCVLKLDFSNNNTQFATIIFPEYSYPIKIVSDRRRFDLSIDNRMQVGIDYSNSLKIDAKLSSIKVPIKLPKSKRYSQSIINLSLLLENSKSGFKIDTSHLDVALDKYFLSTDFTYVNNFLNVDKLFFSDSKSQWQADAFVAVPQSMDFRELSFTFSAFQKNGNGKIIFNASKGNNSTDFLIKVSDLSVGFLENFNISFINTNLNLRTDFKSVQYASGNILTRDLKGNHILTGDIDFDGNNINLNNGFFKYKKVNFESAKISFDSKEKHLKFSSKINLGYWRLDKVLPATSTLSADLFLQSPLFSSGINISNIQKLMKSITLKGSLDISDTYLDDLRFDDSQCELEYKDSLLLLSGEQVSVNVDLRDGNNINVSFLLSSPTFPLSGKFGFKKKKNEMILSFDIYNLTSALMTKLIMNPIITFHKGSFRGWGDVKVNDKNVDMKCSLASNEIVATVLWLENERVFLNDVNIVADGSNLKLKCGNSYSVNRVLGKTCFLERFEAGMYFMPEDLIPYWYVNVIIPDKNYVQAMMPVIPMDFTIDILRANGEFSISGRGMGNILISGDLLANDVSMSTPSRAPDWFVKEDSSGHKSMAFEASVDFDANIRVGKNVNLSYPNPENALVNATLKEGQSARVTYTDKTGAFNINNYVEIERGEVFYFNRKFIIESGSFSWPGREKSDFLSLKNTDMKINLSASLRDFDKNGKSIDLYMNFKDASMNNLTPQFSASVPMEQSEVLYRFGQSIYNTQSSTRQENFTNSASLLMDMTFALGAMRGAGSFSIGGNFAKKMGLDVWTFRSQIISSFIAQTSLFVLDNSYSLSENVFSRFIDKTSISLAKKIDNDKILSLQLELRSITDPLMKNKGIELMHNLYCGMNFSFEWMTPIARILVLSSPEDFSIPGVLSGLAMSVTRTVNF